MKQTITTLYEVYWLLLEVRTVRFFIGGNEMTVLYTEIRREGDSSLRFVAELVERDTRNDSVSWQSDFGCTRVIVESDKKAQYATIILAPLNIKQYPLTIKLERKSLPRKFR